MANDSFKFKLAASQPQIQATGGTIREANQGSFPVLEGGGLAICMLDLKPGAVRIPHWHPDANELDYVLHGKAEVAIVGPDPASGQQRVEQKIEVTPGEISFIPQGWFHSIRNIGAEDLSMLVIFSNSNPNDIGISAAFGGMSHAMLGETFGVPASTFKDFRTDVIDIAPQERGVPGD